MKKLIKVPPSKTEQTIEIDVPDLVINHTVTGTTPLDPVTPPAEPPPPIVVPTPGLKVYGFGSQAVAEVMKQEVVEVTTLTQSMIRSNRILKFTKDVKISGRFDLSNLSRFMIDANGFDVRIDGRNDKDTISINNSQFIIVRGLNVSNAGNDCINVVGESRYFVIMDCTTARGTDGGIDIAEGKYGTLQGNLMFSNKTGEGLNLVTDAYHSLFQNGYIHVTSAKAERNPMIHANYEDSDIGNPNVDMANCLIWNHGRYGSGVDYNATANFRNSYYHAASSANAGNSIMADPDPGGEKGGLFTSGNVSSRGVEINKGNKSTPYVIPGYAVLPMIEAREAAKKILLSAGSPKRSTEETTWLSKVTIN